MRARSNSSLSLPFSPSPAEDQLGGTVRRTDGMARSKGAASLQLVGGGSVQVRPHLEVARTRATPLAQDSKSSAYENLSFPFALIPQTEAEPWMVVSLTDLMSRKQSVKKAQRRLVQWLAEMFQRPAEWIRLEELVDLDQKLIEFLQDLGMERASADGYVREKNKLIAQAKAFDWSSSDDGVRDSWTPILSALRADGETPRLLGLVRWAIAQGISASNFDEDALELWRLEMKKKEYSPVTIRGYDATFRHKMRKAKLEHLLPGLRVGSRNPGVYSKDGNAMGLFLSTDIDAKVQWKSEEGPVEGRDAKYAIGPVVARGLRKLLGQVCGYAERELGMTGIFSLKQVLVPEVLCPMADWLLNVRGCNPRSVEVRLRDLHALLVQHPDFNEKGDDEDKRNERHAWLRAKIAKLPREPKWELGARKNAKSIAHQELAKVPLGIEAALRDAKDDLEIAWLKHDLLFFRLTLCHPWRPRNLRECRIGAPGKPNIVEDTLPPDLRHRLKRSRSPEVAKILKGPRTKRHLRFVFRETDTKEENPVEEMVAPHLVDLLKEYLKKHRKKLLEGRDDPGTVFLNRSYKAMGEKDVLGLYARLTEQHLERRGTPHLNRDSFSAHFLESGGGFDALQTALWQVKDGTTWGYCRRFNASNGAVALDRHLEKVARRKP